MAVAGGGRKPNSPPETEFSKAPPKKPRNHFSTMEELAQSAREVLNTMENEKSNSNDTVHTNKQFERLGSLLGTAPEMGTRDRLRPPPSLPTSNGSSSIGVSPAELREDREIIVKIRDSDTRETLRRRTPREIVEQAERTREQAARRKASAPLGGGCHFLAAKVLPSGDVKMTANSASGAELLRKHADGCSARYRYEDDAVDTGVDGGDGEGAGTPNSHSWGDTQVEILHLGWLVKPGKRREGSIIIEFTDPVVANQAITQGTLWQHQVHQTTRFCREGLSKRYQCGHCAKQHPTWECAKQGDVEVKCANCGGGHRPTSDACEYHYLPVPTGTRYPNPRAAANCTAHDDISGSTYIESDGDRIASDRERTSSDRERIASDKRNSEDVYKGWVEKPQRRKEPSHVMRTRSRTSEDDDLPIIPEELAETASAVSQSARSLRSQNQETMQFMTDPEKQLQTSYKKRRMTAPADDMAEDYVMDEQPERLGDTNWYDTKLLKSTKMRKRSSMMLMASFLSDKAVQKADVIAVQEPWINSQSTTTHYPNKATHQLVFPKELEGERARVCLFVSKRIDPGSWSCKTVSKGYQLLKLRRNHLDGWTDLFMHNIYNNDDGETVEKLNRELAQRPYAEHILIGDMNLHHPTWSGIGSKAKATAAAERLLDIAGIHNLSLTTETGSPTWRRNEQASVLDLTFVSNTLAERVVECQVGTDHGSDHYPVVTTIDIGTPPYEPPKRRNWKATDDKKLIEFIERQLTNTTTNTNNTTTTNTTTNPQNLTTADDVEAECQAFIQIINDAVDISTPWAIPSQWANPSFTPESGSSQRRDPYDKELYKAARNRKTRLIKIALRRYHRRKVQEVIEGPGGVTPSIKIPGGLAETVEEKAAAFQQAFFPVPPPADLSDIDSKVINHDPTEINRGPIRFPEITHQEIKQAVKASPPDKAPGEDGLPNSLWHKLIEIPTVLDTISRIYNACIRLGTNPTHFQKSITVVLRKAGKRDYQLAKSYRPVALLNTLGKFLEAVVARRISYAVETYKLLPDTHFGGRKGISVDHAIQSIIGRIRRAWGKGKIASMLLLDVSGAYDNVSHERLLYNLRKRGLGQLAPWVKAFLTSRSTRIRIPEGVSESIPTPTGIPQGSPLSPILYLIYNADLVEGCEGVKTSGWVDDVAFIVIGKGA
ncbi:hypothetical protein PDIDSM_8148 [Penicillium digitatum]|nr:hypothetical protein PDIDSM_8148 [Penicillium digitatum]